MAGNLKGVEWIARPPLTSIPERLHLLAEEIDASEKSILVIAYPSGTIYNYGEALNKHEVVDILTEASQTMLSSNSITVKD